MTLTERVSAALHELALLNETPASASFDARIKGGESAGPQPVDTALDFFVRRLERWVSEAEKRIESERKGQADGEGQVPELNTGQKLYYLIHSGAYEGVPYRKAAEDLGLEAEYVLEQRKKHGLTAVAGRPRKRPVV